MAADFNRFRVCSESTIPCTAARFSAPRSLTSGRWCSTRRACPGWFMFGWLGAFLVGSFSFIRVSSAWYLLRDRHTSRARSFTVLILATLACPLVAGHHQAGVVARHQPAKLAAMEGLYRSEKGAPLYVFGLPDDATRRVRWGLGFPGGLSLLVHGDPSAEVPGLDDLEATWGKPPVAPTFVSYHMMIGIGMLFIGSTLYATYLRWRGRLFETRWLLWFFVFAIGLAVVANEAGWVAAEVGRQPWVVYPQVVGGQVVGGLRTSAALSEVVRSEQVFGSIVMFGVVDLMLLGLWLTVLHHKIQEGPTSPGSHDTQPDPDSKGEGAVMDVAAAPPSHSDSLTRPA
ncbi:MAG: cytochrome ubiquinol oxidase subunit I [Isosphaeraceae bacterium]